MTADSDWLAFRQELERHVGVPLGAYKEPQMKRRLETVMNRRKLNGWAAFAAALNTDTALLDLVRDTLTINVSEFFRQAERFQELQERILPELIKERGQLKIWSAGCSIGCEPYTLAMILNEIDPRGGHSILATDVDLPILARAKSGTGYIPNEVRSVPPAYLSKYFDADGSGFRVKDDLRRRVNFRRHDLLSDPYPQNVDMILCRNVVIYFNEQAKAHIYKGFTEALRPGGYLFVGGSEMIVRSLELGLRSASTSLYRRAA